jgi:hypothetical protein
VKFFNEFYFQEDLRSELVVPPAKKLEDLIHLAELCVDLLQQNEEHYAEVNFIAPNNFKIIFIIFYSLLFHLIGL